MRPRPLDRRLGKRQSKGVALVPGLPLVQVVGAEEIPRLAGYQIQGRCIQIRQVDGHAFRRPVSAGHRLDRESTARLRLDTRASRRTEEWNPLQDLVLYLHRIETA